MPRRILITVAETSGDKYAAGFVRALRSLDPEVRIDAFGGTELSKAGANVLVETVSGAAMTIHGVKRVFEVSRWLKLMQSRYNGPDKPDLHVCVDSSGFNLHFARAAKRCGVPVLYYVAPQLWASREGRIRQLRKYVDRLACIFPFEEQWFRERGVNASFVGHPLFDELPHQRTRSTDEGTKTVGVIPGSRGSEVRANLPHLLDVASRIDRSFPGTRFLIPTTPSTTDEVLRLLASAHPPLPTVFVRENAFDQFVPMCDLVLCKSGTSTVHVAAWNVPMIVVYRINPILWHGAGRWLVKTRKIAMVNILAGQTDAVPEFVPWYGSNEPVARCAIHLLKHPAELEAQRERLRTIIAPIDKPGAGMNVARIALEMMA